MFGSKSVGGFMVLTATLILGCLAKTSLAVDAASLSLARIGAVIGAKYAPAAITHTLTVSTSPISGVTIGVSPADNNAESHGTTGFTRVYDEGTVVTLRVPAAYNDAGIGYTFDQWTVNGVPQLFLPNPLVITLSADTTVNAEFVLDGPVCQVEGHDLNLFRISPIDGHSHLDGQWLGIRYASDGNVYHGSSDHAGHEGAAFFKYDTRAHAETLLWNDLTTLAGDDPWLYPQGKLHSDIVEANGWVYWTTHFSSEYPNAASIWPGAHLQGYCLATGAFRDFGVIFPKCTSYCGIAVDVPRNLGYVFVCPMDSDGFAVAGGCHIVKYDLATGARTDLGVLRAGIYDTLFWFFIDKRGDCWFSLAYDHGDLRGIRYGATTYDRYPNVLPPLTNYGSDTINSDSWYQDNRWVAWGSRCRTATDPYSAWGSTAGESTSSTRRRTSCPVRHSRRRHSSAPTISARRSAGISSSTFSARAPSSAGKRPRISICSVLTSTRR